MLAIALVIILPIWLASIILIRDEVLESQSQSIATETAEAEMTIVAARDVEAIGVVEATGVAVRSAVWCRRVSGFCGADDAGADVPS